MNESVLILTDRRPENLPQTQFIEIQEIELEKLFKQSTTDKIPVTYLYVNQDFRTVFIKIKGNTKVIKAAGGLVKNGRGEYLFIHRLNRWDLPKGKVEPNEKMRKAAVREVEEECGIKVDSVKDLQQSSSSSYLSLLQ